jgi:hypothetical protein
MGTGYSKERPLSLEYLVRSEGEGAIVGPDALPEMTPNGILLGEQGVISRPFTPKKSNNNNISGKEKTMRKVIKNHDF